MFEENLQKRESLSRSPERNTFLLNSTSHGYKTLLEKENQRNREMENDPKWAVDNMEYDLRTTSWILKKVRKSNYYAQHLYAALCNNDFIKATPWDILIEKTWSCSWRHSGGIIADMQKKGDYNDWYCSGIAPTYVDFETRFLNEGIVSDEIREDLKKLGWLVKRT